MLINDLLKATSVAVLAMTTATAQPSNAVNTNTNTSTSTSTNVNHSAAGQPSPSVGFQSTFSDYVPYSEQAITSWRQANDKVGEIGGWKTYAREARLPDLPDLPAPSLSLEQAPPLSSETKGPHQ